MYVEQQANSSSNDENEEPAAEAMNVWVEKSTRKFYFFPFSLSPSISSYIVSTLVQMYMMVLKPLVFSPFLPSGGDGRELFKRVESRWYTTSGYTSEGYQVYDIWNT